MLKLAFFFAFFLLFPHHPSSCFGHVTGSYDDQVDERSYEMFLQHSLFHGSYSSLPTTVNNFLSSVQTLATQNHIPLTINLNSLGEEVLNGFIYDTVAEPNGKLYAQNIELAFDAYTSSYRGLQYLVSIMFSNTDPSLSFKPGTAAQTPNMLIQEFELQMYPTQTTFVHENTVFFTTPGFQPKNLNDFSTYFTPYTLSLLDIPLSTTLMAVELEYERLIWRSASLGGYNATICVEFVYPNTADLQSNAKPVEIEFMLQIFEDHGAGSQVFQYAQQLQKLMAANPSWNAQYVKGIKHVRLFWVFVAAIAALILGAVACYIVHMRAQRASGARLFETEH